MTGHCVLRGQSLSPGWSRCRGLISALVVFWLASSGMSARAQSPAPVPQSTVSGPPANASNDVKLKVTEYWAGKVRLDSEGELKGGTNNSTSYKQRGLVRLNHVISVKVDGLEQWLKDPKHKASDFILVLDGTEFPGLAPGAIQNSVGEFSARHSERREWSQLSSVSDVRLDDRARDCVHRVGETGSGDAGI